MVSVINVSHVHFIGIKMSRLDLKPLNALQNKYVSVMYKNDFTHEVQFREPQNLWKQLYDSSDASVGLALLLVLD